MSSLMTGAVKKALDARRRLGLGQNEPIDVIHVLRHLDGITVIHRPFEGSISGCFMRGSLAKVIVINSARSLGHQRFTMAHEYYHLLFESERSGGVCTTERFAARGSSESYADDFAANFLIPHGGLAEALYRLEYSTSRPLKMADLIELEHLFGVSHRAMLVRLRHLGYITAAQVKQLDEGVIKESEALGYGSALYRPTDISEVQSPYMRLAREALGRGLISKGKCRELMMEGGFFDLIS